MQWLAQAGVDVVLGAQPHDRTQPITAADIKQSLKTAPTPPQSGQPARQPARPAAASGVAEVAHAQSAADASADIPALKAAMEAFGGCALKTTATQLVFADGPCDANLMIIGEAPGREEDLEGKPFVGAAGQLLNKILAAAGMPRESVYITNIVPWRPPGNRKPTPLETQICLPFVKRHIALAQPKKLLLLGGTPANALTGKPEGITRLRGRWHALQLGNALEIKALPTFHPAYLLRQPAHKSFIWADILQLKSALAP